MVVWKRRWGWWCLCCGKGGAVVEIRRVIDRVMALVLVWKRMC